jgi:hypothetical protein
MEFSEQGDLYLMKTVLLILKRSLFVPFGLMALAAVSFSSTLPRFLWLSEQDGDGLAARPAVKPTLQNSVGEARTSGSRAAEKSKSDSSATKTTKKTMDRKTAQATLALTGCKDHAPNDGAPDVAARKTTSRKTYTNSTQEKRLCNPESPRSR